MLITIDTEFQALIPPLSADERAQLEANILADGCRDPLVVWLKPAPQPGDHKCYVYDETKCDLHAGDGVWTCNYCDHNPALLEYVLIDGHNRYEICTKHGLPFDTVEYEFASRDEAMDWMDANQLGRRNLSPEMMSLIRGRIYNRRKKAQGGTGANQHKQTDQNDPSAPTGTAEALGEQFGVSAPTIKRDGKFAEAVEAIKPHVPDIEQRVISGGVSRKDVVEAAAVPEQAAERLAHNHRAQGTGENEWYTPQDHIDRARQVLGDFDLDPASSEIANQLVRAAQIFTIEDDGLEHEWAGRVWMNPPYSQPHIAQFMEKLATEYESGNVKEAIALTHNYTDTAWFHRGAKACDAICFTRGRIGFVNPEGKRAAPTQGQAFSYFGPNVDQFARVFADVGFVVEVRHE